MGLSYVCDKCKKVIVDEHTDAKMINNYFKEILCGKCYNEYFAIVSNWLRGIKA